MELKADDEFVKKLHFKAYQYVVERQATKFSPPPNSPQQQTIQTPWGATLTIQSGDYFVNELDAPEDKWPVARDIFEQTYEEVKPGIVVKKETAELIPLVDVADSPNEMVTIHTLEGVVEVRAGDFYLARGSQGEIWPFPKAKVGQNLRPADETKTED